MFPSRVFLCSTMTLVKGVDLYHRVMQEFFSLYLSFNAFAEPGLGRLCILFLFTKII